MTQDETIDAIMQVMERAFDPYWREAWNRRQVTDSFALPSTHALLIDAQGNIAHHPAETIGFVLSRIVLDEEELLLVAIAPEYRGKQLGKRLIEHSASAARDRGATRLFLEMRANNPADRVYRAAGFERIGMRKDYYRTADGEKLDAITFGRNLTN
ncbi:GNAT family N-acetyltransferase [Qipengyuania sp. DY56-A-20]|jgi:ribosomal-protein-alanine N-acetyltransferase|uniref:GNAT family N-acetyltransferase n=1 Tax=Qipengyuania benthica TaxID=3067651 RepID=A0ABT9H908_9SPHN|nr:GNAT family N-acetyltransferase [Qipengyuania sp. DY56-A-20]MDP4539794.1 GNAT family N-acetyltransferase [Qipengyuania sp. DY56-A-20]